MHIKDFDGWNEKKKEVDSSPPFSLQGKQRYFNEREIWWAHIGQNIGFEICGKGEGSLRPVLIVKKFSADSALVIPLGTQKKVNRFTVFLGKTGDKESYTNVSQMRLMDTRRFTDKIAMCSQESFHKVKEKARSFLL